MGKQSREKEMRRFEKQGQRSVSTDLRSSLEKYTFLIIEIGVFLALITPAVLIKDYFFPFVVPKTIYFRIIVDIMFMAYVLLAISNPKYRPKITPLTATIALFIGVGILASVLGVNFQRSFWSVFERMTGILTFLHLFVFFIILTSCFKERKYWERFLAFSIMVGLYICFYAWTAKTVNARGGGTVGNTSFMASYLIFNIFFTIILFFTKGNWWKIFAAIALMILLAGILVSIEPSDAAKLALTVGAFVLGFSYLMFYLFSSGKTWMKKLAFFIILFLVLGMLLALQIGFVKNKIIGIWGSSSLQSRMVIWNIAIHGWQDRPLLGWGLENFYRPYAKYFDPQLPLTRDLWYDRAHNVVFDTLVDSGILGLISYFLIYIVAVFSLLRILPKVSERKNLFFPLGLISLLAAYFVQNLFNFDMISSYMTFFFTLAVTHFLIYPELKESAEENQQKEIKNKNPLLLFGNLVSRYTRDWINPILASFLIVLAIITIYFGNILPAQASRYTVRGLSLPLEESVLYFQKALAISPISKPEVPEQFSIRMTELISQPVTNMKLLQEGMKTAEEVMKKSIANDPYNFRFQLFLARYYVNIYQIFGGMERIEEAEKILQNSILLSPRNQQIYWTQSQIMLFRGRMQEALETLKKAMELEPRLGVSHWYLGLTYRIAKNYALAVPEFELADKLGYEWKNNIDDLKKVIEVYIALGDKPALIPLYEKAVQLVPKDYEFWISLADLYADTGQIEKAKSAAEKVMELAPDKTEQVKEFLRGLGY